MKKTITILMASSVLLFASANKDSEGMYHSNTGNAPSVAEAVSNTTGGTVYTGIPGGVNSTASKNSEALYQHNSGTFSKKVTAEFIPKPPPIIKTVWKTVYEDRIIYIYEDCGTTVGDCPEGSDCSTPPPPEYDEDKWRWDSGKWLEDGITYSSMDGFTIRVFDEPRLYIYSTPWGGNTGEYFGASGGIGFSDGSYLQWGSVWRGGTGGNKRSWYFLYNKRVG